jgi:hypothetical protein
MGALEAIVVVYLRQIYYPAGFDFPLILLSPRMFFVECLREIATIAMLIMVGVIAGKNALQRFACFLFAFAVWDIFYYVWLKVLLNWPASFLTWDLLFLIPVPWVGPVLAPIIVSLTMILFSAAIIYFQASDIRVKIKWSEWSLTLIGALIIILTFVWDYTQIIVNEVIVLSLRNILISANFWEAISTYKPSYYNWYLFVLGEGFIISAIIRFLKANKIKS